MNNTDQHPITPPVQPFKLLRDILFHDVFSACAVATLVSPIVAAIDATVVENTNVQRSIAENVSIAANKYKTVMRKALHTPTSLLTKPNGLIFGVYASTFIMFNCAKRFTTDDMTIIGATTAVNVSMGVVKDKFFVDMYGKEKVFGKIPIPPTPMCRLIGVGGIGMFVLRDFFVLGSSLIVPKKIADIYISSESTTPPTPPTSTSPTNHSSMIETVAQVIAPLAIQLIAAPLHIMGITLVNKPLEWSQSLTVVRSCFANTYIAKTIRIIPTFILGTLGNRYIMSVVEPESCGTNDSIH